MGSKRVMYHMVLKNANQPFVALSDKVHIEPSREIAMAEMSGGSILDFMQNPKAGILSAMAGLFRGPQSGLLHNS
jgi:hypothetical protein